ncbi:hypothetical protein HL653_08210 [Sphingomonas sp. AP4-R1]|uniref:hypothetical protein n=1 Tax=Sphingomonas sp. AP4-R1 TaxID=2735134 RepID=UPI0014932FD1|nr:hypothetical protein [Sphingomonas sp. AP4-R1]QJU57773.1 hypothetical protein HL653_08210 [Sphingomonas sp. AP4-R1]
MTGFTGEVREVPARDGAFQVVIVNGVTTVARLSASSRSEAERIRDDIVRRFRDLDARWPWMWF